MLKTVLWIAGACAAVLLALAVSRNMKFDDAPPTSPAVVVDEPVETPVVAPPPPPEPESSGPCWGCWRAPMALIGG